MFADAIEKTSKFTRSIHFISRRFDSTEIIPGTATLFFVNDEGVAITCKHVSKILTGFQKVNDRYKQYKSELASIPNDEDRDAQADALTIKHGYTPSETAQMEVLFYDCIKTSDDSISFTSINHSEFDLAIIKIKNATSNLYSGHAVFAKDSNNLKVGTFLCRIGYPFPQFSNYRYDATNDSIEWTQMGRVNTPLFPIEGMFTREVTSGGNTFAYEISTPGLRGQSGGPLFDRAGVVYGMQSETAFLHLGFDKYNTKVRIDGEMKEVEDHPFMHVGRCICVDVIKKFLDDNNIKYYVDDGNGGEDLVNG